MIWKNSLAEGNKFLKDAGLTPKGSKDLGIMDEEEVKETDPIKAAMIAIAQRGKVQPDKN